MITDYVSIPFLVGVAWEYCTVMEDERFMIRARVTVTPAVLHPLKYGSCEHET